jgi:hypothetical protein
MLAAIADELARARAKFPQQDVWVTLAALTEEVGELNQAILQRAYQAAEKNVTVAHIRKEAVQVAVMALRVALDCNVEAL